MGIKSVVLFSRVSVQIESVFNLIFLILSRSWVCTMMVTQVPTIITTIKVKHSSFTHKLKQLIVLFPLAPLVLIMKNVGAKKGARIGTLK